MFRHIARRVFIPALIAVAALGVRADVASAHCDGMDGPVVAAGARALETGDVRHALVWVLPAGAAEVSAAFEHALKVRAIGDDARALADTYFFETLVRVHRAGEGEPYTGLKPAGRDHGPLIRAADLAVVSGSADELERLLLDAVRHGLEERFHAMRHLADYEPVDVERGREFVAAYVALLHYLEELHAVVAGTHRHAGDQH